MKTSLSKTLLVVLVSTAAFWSCSSSDQENIPGYGEPVALNVQISGGSSRSAAAAESELLSKDTLVYDSGGNLFKVSIREENDEASALRLAPITTLTGVVSRLLVFDSGTNLASLATPSDGNYVGCYNITGTAVVGNPYDDSGSTSAPSLTLTSGHIYTFIAYSNGTGTLPTGFDPAGGMSPGELTALQSLGVNPATSDALAFKQIKLITEVDNNINVLFKHVFSQLIVRVSGANLSSGVSLTDVTDGTLTGNYSGTYNYVSGSFTSSGTDVGCDIEPFANVSGVPDVKQSDPALVSCPGSDESTISVSYKTDGTLAYGDLTYTLPASLSGGSTYYVSFTPQLDPPRLGAPGWIPVPNGALNNKLSDGVTDDEDDNYDWLHFKEYNEGATVIKKGTYKSIAKAQMAYDVTGQTAASVDMAVYGGLYQWGRKNGGHGVRYSGNTNTTTTQVSDWATDPGSLFVNVSGNWYSGPNPDLLWGNGAGVSGQTAAPGIAGDNFSGFSGDCHHVPSQYEWALLFSANTSGVNGANVADDRTNDVIVVPTAGRVPAGNPNIVVFPVVNKAVSTANAAGKMCGLVIYLARDQNAVTANKNDLTAAAAPKPLLFLPRTGLRTSAGNIALTSTIGYYWSSTVRPSPLAEWFEIQGNNATVSSSYSQEKRYGTAIRCLQ